MSSEAGSRRGVYDGGKLAVMTDDSEMVTS